MVSFGRNYPAPRRPQGCLLFAPAPFHYIHHMNREEEFSAWGHAPGSSLAQSAQASRHL